MTTPSPEGGPPHPRKRPQQARSRITVGAMLEAAYQVMEADGYDGLTTTRLAKRAGVSVGTVYQYFPDKDAVVGALIEAYLQKEERALLSAVEAARGLPFAEAAPRLVRAFADVQAEAPERTALLLAGAPPSRWLPEIDALARRSVGVVAALFRERHAEIPLPDPDLAAFVVVHALDGVFRKAVAERPDAVASGAVSEEAERLVWSYLAASMDAG